MMIHRVGQIWWWLCTVAPKRCSSTQLMFGAQSTTATTTPTDTCRLLLLLLLHPITAGHTASVPCESRRVLGRLFAHTTHGNIRCVWRRGWELHVGLVSVRVRGGWAGLEAGGIGERSQRRLLLVVLLMLILVVVLYVWRWWVRESHGRCHHLETEMLWRDLWCVDGPVLLLEGGRLAEGEKAGIGRVVEMQASGIADIAGGLWGGDHVHR